LLEQILGQQRDPIQVQKHIKKCFEGIRTLEMIPIGKSNNKTVEAVGMNAPDGEQVMFVGKVIVDGPVEDWLIRVMHPCSQLI
jgi:dynein heavy chain